jgi:ElaB/YqjD/DUF883 family membrane-anchored ribosome-binding protein
MLENLTQYLNEMKLELQDLYEDLDNELRNTENQALIDDSYHNVVSNLETALNEMETLIGDLSAGVYNNSIDLGIDEYDSEVDD